MSGPGSGAEQARAPAPLVVEELRRRWALGALARDWERLRSGGGLPGPFVSPRTLAITARHLCDGAHPLSLLVAMRDGTLEAALPLVRERRLLAGLPARVLRSLSDEHSQRFDALCPTQEAANALLRELLARGGWDLVELRDIPDSEPLPRSSVRGAQPRLETGAERLCRAARDAGLSVYDWPSLVSPTLELPSTAAEFERRLGSHLRGNLRRRRRRLEEEQGPVTLEVVGRAQGRAAILAALDEGFALEAASWKGRAGTAIAQHPALIARYRAWALSHAHQDELLLCFLRVAGVRQAFHFSLLVDGSCALFKTGNAPHLLPYGPGQLLVELVARHLIERGIRTLDLLGDDLDWKHPWTELVRPHSWRLIFAPTWRGRLLGAWKGELVPWLSTALRTRLSPHLSSPPSPDRGPHGNHRTR
jgi:CelD/BcsL family acetyltransferase involved in cellulose biosynthesis